MTDTDTDTDTHRLIAPPSTAPTRDSVARALLARFAERQAFYAETGRLTTDDGRGYVKWAIDKMARLTDDGRAALREALNAPTSNGAPDPVAAIKLQDALNRAAALNAISPEQAERVDHYLQRLEEVGAEVSDELLTIHALEVRKEL